MPLSSAPWQLTAARTLGPCSTPSFIGWPLWSSSLTWILSLLWLQKMTEAVVSPPVERGHCQSLFFMAGFSLSLPNGWLTSAPCCVGGAYAVGDSQAHSYLLFSAGPLHVSVFSKRQGLSVKRRALTGEPNHLLYFSLLTSHSSSAHSSWTPC